MPPYLLAVTLLLGQHEMEKLASGYLFYQNAAMHFQLFYMSQSAKFNDQTNIRVKNLENLEFF